MRKARAHNDILCNFHRRKKLTIDKDFRVTIRSEELLPHNGGKRKSCPMLHKGTFKKKKKLENCSSKMYV